MLEALSALDPREHLRCFLDTGLDFARCKCSPGGATEEWPPALFPVFIPLTHLVHGQEHMWAWMGTGRTGNSTQEQNKQKLKPEGLLQDCGMERDLVPKQCHQPLSWPSVAPPPLPATHLLGN